MDAEDMLYILYTSGTTGSRRDRPHDRRISRRNATTKWVFDLKEDDVYWCTADIGWVRGTATSSTGRWPTVRRS